MDNKKKYWAEFIGTFLLVFLGTGSIVIGEEYNGILQAFGIGLVFGITVWLLVQFLGRFSDCHINPAVTIAFLAKREISWLTAIYYIIFQFTGAVLGSVVLHLLFKHNQNLGNTLPSGTALESFVYEFFLSCGLMLVILISTSVRKLSKWAPFLIGLTVFLEAWLAGPICGASMNPARSFGPAVVSGDIRYLWLYIIAPIGGMLFGWVLFTWSTRKVMVQDV